MNNNEELEKAVLDALESIRPFLKADGGDIELVAVTDEGVAQVRLQGACSDCSMSLQTMKLGVETVVKKAVPQIIGVEAV